MFTTLIGRPNLEVLNINPCHHPKDLAGILIRHSLQYTTLVRALDLSILVG